MGKVRTQDLIGAALDWAVAKCEGFEYTGKGGLNDFRSLRLYDRKDRAVLASVSWSQGGPIIERENITIIRANSLYVDGKSVPNWFAETDKWVGHNICTGYEGEYFDPCFMVDESGGYYGPTPLIAAMRCYVANKLGSEVEVPDELL